jgi:hypothetical protein
MTKITRAMQVLEKASVAFTLRTHACDPDADGIGLSQRGWNAATNRSEANRNRPRPRRLHRPATCQAASEVRAVDFSRTGLPPGGFLGEGSRLDSASRISSMDTVRLAPGMARKAGHDVTAAASDAHDARTALFSARDSAASASTSRG